MRAVLKVCLTVLGTLALGCSALLSSATMTSSGPPASVYMSEAKPPKPCDHPVELLRSAEAAQRPYTEVASLSSTCYPGTPTLCERILLQHACQQQADAVIVSPAQSGATPAGNPEPQISMSGRAVRWAQQ